MELGIDGTSVDLARRGCRDGHRVYRRHQSSVLDGPDPLCLCDTNDEAHEAHGARRWPRS
jgi:hypothetical protein